MSTVDYSPLEQLSEELHSKIKELKSGKMKPEDVSGLTSSARQVYERLVILEFQAHEKGSDQTKSVEKEMPAIKIDTTAEVKNQTSLIDVIEEIEEDQEKQLANKEAEKETVEEKVEEPAEVEETPQEEEKIEQVVADTEESEESESSASLAERFEQAPIADIGKSISLNEKFQFIRVLCANNSDNFNKLVAAVNDASDEKAALDFFTQSVSEPDDEENKEVYEKFKELISRRFIA